MFHQYEETVELIIDEDVKEVYLRNWNDDLALYELHSQRLRDQGLSVKLIKSTTMFRCWNLQNSYSVVVKLKRKENVKELEKRWRENDAVNETERLSFKVCSFLIKLANERSQKRKTIKTYADIDRYEYIYAFVYARHQKRSYFKTVIICYLQLSVAEAFEMLVWDRLEEIIIDMKKETRLIIYLDVNENTLMLSTKFMIEMLWLLETRMCEEYL